MKNLSNLWDYSGIQFQKEKHFINMNHSFKNTYTYRTIQSPNAEQIAKIYQKIKDYINQPAIQDIERPVDQEMFGEMIRIVLSNLNNQQIIENYKAKLTTSQIIIFNQLLTIYHNFKKSKEELTKYCIRNAFKYLGERVNKKSQKEAYETCIQQYFGNNGFHLPYKKYQTSFKSMNSQFLRMLFKSPKFAVDFEEFLSINKKKLFYFKQGNFKKYAMVQNERKIALLIDQIQFPLKDELNLGGIRRIPWPIDVINQSINIGSNLLNFSDLVPKSQKNSSQTDEI